MATPGFLHASPPIEPGGAISTTPGESASSRQLTLDGHDLGMLDSYRNNSNSLPKWLKYEIERGLVIVKNRNDLLGDEKPTRANQEAQRHEKTYVRRHDGLSPDNDLYLYIKSQFLQYLEHQKKKHIILRAGRSYIKGQSIYRVLPYNNRFSSRYQRNLKRRLDELARRFAGKPGVMLTLTLDPKKYDWNVKMMWTTLKSEYNRFLTNMFKVLGHRIEYLCVPEAMPGSGLPHLHIVFFNVTRVMDWRKITALWKLGIIRINRTPKGKFVRAPVKYITKYITKTFNKTTDANVLSQSLLWYYGIRSFSMSRGLMPPMFKKHILQQYTLAGSIWCYEDAAWKYINAHPALFDILLSTDG